LVGGDFNQNGKLFNTNNPWNEERLEEENDQELNVTGVVIEEGEVVDTTFNDEHEGPEEGDNDEDQSKEFTLDLGGETWEGGLDESNVEIEETEDRIDTKVDTEEEEDDGKEDSTETTEHSNEGWESNEEEGWTGLGNFVNGNVSSFSNVTEESENGNSGIDRSGRVSEWNPE